MEFLEAGHGKGAADGVGAAVKRSADRFVCQGHDIIHAEGLYRQLITSKTTMELFLIEEDMFQSVDDTLKPAKENICALPGTMKLHQVGHEINKMKQYTMN